MQISFNDIQKPENKDKIFNPFEKKSVSEIIDDLNSQIHNDSQLKENK